MGPKSVFAAVLCAGLAGWSGLSAADEYRPGEFLSLDLSKAVLSPKLLGPETHFAPVRIEAHADSAKPVARAKRVNPARTHVAHQRADTPRGVSRTRIARRHGNPLDAQAADTRIQVWPCKSGGICGWKR